MLRSCCYRYFSPIGDHPLRCSYPQSPHTCNYTLSIHIDFGSCLDFDSTSLHFYIGSYRLEDIHIRRMKLNLTMLTLGLLLDCIGFVGAQIVFMNIFVNYMIERQIKINFLPFPILHSNQANTESEKIIWQIKLLRPKPNPLFTYPLDLLINCKLLYELIANGDNIHGTTSLMPLYTFMVVLLWSKNKQMLT